MDGDETKSKGRKKGKTAKWETNTVELRTAMKISRSYSPWTDREDVKLTNVVKKPRILDAINVAWAARLIANKKSANPMEEEDLKKCFYIDVSQGVERKGAYGSITALCKGAHSDKRHWGFYCLEFIADDQTLAHQNHSNRDSNSKVNLEPDQPQNRSSTQTSKLLRYVVSRASH